MKTTRVNLTIEWKKAPTGGRFTFDHVAEVAGAFLIVGWGTLSKDDGKLALTSAGELCRLCFGLLAEGAEDDIATVCRFTDTELPFEFCIENVLQQENEELKLPEPGVKIVAEIDHFAML